MSRLTIPLRILAVLAAVTLVAAACGDDDDAGDLASDAEEETEELVEEAEDLVDEAEDLAEDVAEDAGEVADEVTDDAGEVADDAGEVADEAADIVEEQREALEEAIEEEGGGGATLTAGDETWTFDTVVCAFGPEEIGQEGAELVVTGISDGLQLYVSIDSFGHSVDLQDIDDFENPRVSLTAFGGIDNPDEFIEVDGKSVTATDITLVDDTADGARVPGSLEATCP